MSILWVLSALALLQFSAAVSLTYDDDVQCANVPFPPTEPDRQVPTSVVNLDLPPNDRWKETVVPRKQEIQELIGVILHIVENITGSNALVDLIDVTLPILWSTLPEPYKSEILGVARYTEISLGRITLYNIFYEIFTVCTSVVVQDEKGYLYHGRNLDFGLILGYDLVRNTWMLPPYLRNLSVNVHYVSAGKVLYQSTSLAGYVGVLTGLKPNAFSVTINERFNLHGGFVGLYDWIFKSNHTLRWTGFLMREVLETQNSYSDAKRLLSTVPVMSPAYYILGGVNAGEACMITRDLQKPADVWEMSSIAAHPWFILQTNYDHTAPLPFFDDRGTPGSTCMLKQGQKNAGYGAIFNVLNTVPNLNQLTVHASIMCTRCGDDIKAYLQHCPTDKYCSMW